jgi:hypothetical protein
MVELIVDRLERLLHVGEIHHPAAVRVDVTAQMQLDTEGMAVQAGALVPCRDIGQTVGCFDSEGAEDIHGVRRLSDAQ